MKNKKIKLTNSYIKKQLNKAFTLIELLAIIVILAIIAVITIPIILNVIENASKGAAQDSAYGYKDAIQKYGLSKLMNDTNSDSLSGSYTVEELKNLGLEVTGEEPNSGSIIIDDNGISGCLQFNEYASKLYQGDIVSTEKGSCPSEKLVTTGDGLYTSSIEPGRYIYRGKNVNNYIKLKENNADVIYRIISYEKDGSIKVIRDTSIGNMAWDERTSETEGPRRNDNNTYCNYTGTYYGCNVWSNMNDTTYNGTPLSTLFSNNFHYKYFSSSTSELLDHSTNGTVKDNSSLNTYLNGEWLTNSGLNDYINPNTNFSVGGLYYYSTYTGGDKGLEKELEEINSYKWQGKVGLMYITDMVETSLSNSCDSVYDNYYYNPNYYYKDTDSETASQHVINGNWPCTKDNWLFKGITEWSLSAISNDRYSVWRVNSTGSFSNSYGTYGAFGARPAFYLKSPIQLSGSGTILDPYEIDAN